MSKKEESEKFSLEVETLAMNLKCSYLEAIQMYCETNGIEFELISKLLTKALKEKITIEASRENLIKGGKLRQVYQWSDKW